MNARPSHCPLCGYVFTADEGTKACRACPTAPARPAQGIAWRAFCGGCTLIACPRCRYEWTDESRLVTGVVRLIRWMKERMKHARLN